MPLRDFQKTASAFLQTRLRALLCDDAGLGKSAVALDAADALGLSRVLVVGPAVAGVSWPLELARWSPRRAFADLDQALNFGVEMPGLYFISYDVLSRGAHHAQTVQTLATCTPWDVIILDEGQYLKTPGANRTHAVYGPATDRVGGIAENTDRIWVLSGTLAPNHAGEVYTHLCAVFPDILQAIPAFHGRVPEEYEFQAHFCRVQDTVFGRVVQGSRNQRELRRHIEPVMLRRRKADVMPELAPMEWFTAPIAMTAPIAVVDTLSQQLGYLTPGCPPPDDSPTPEDAARTAARRDLGLYKVPGCVDWIEARLGAGEPKILVFAHHRDVLAAIYASLADHSPVLFHGDTAPADRAEAVRRFQRDPGVRVFVGQIQAAGTAITLTAAKCVFFAEFGTTPGVNYQAASRAHRMGQHDGVQVYFASVPHSLDERIAATASRRARELAELFD